MRSQRDDPLRKHIGRILGSHTRWSGNPEHYRRYREYRTMTSPNRAHLIVDVDRPEPEPCLACMVDAHVRPSA